MSKETIKITVSVRYCHGNPNNPGDYTEYDETSTFILQEDGTYKSTIDWFYYTPEKGVWHEEFDMVKGWKLES